MSRSPMPNVRLAPIAPRHADAVQNLASHPDVLATTNLPEPYPDDGAITWIEAVQEQREVGREYPFAILNDETLVGVTGLRDVTDDRGEVGFWIGRPYWNRGYATAGTRQLLAFAFGNLGLGEVFARPLKRNTPSRRVLEKLGFTTVAEEMHEHPKWTADDPVVRYELTRPDGRSDTE
ncbi:MAG: GNAT family N-acetyltransferase [Salinibacter sp.]